MTTQVVRGGLWTLSGQGVMISVSLIATTFVIRWLGSELYGVFVLINVLIGYIGFADLGMATASTRFGGEAFARHDGRGEAAVIETSLIVTLIPAVVVAGLLMLCAGPIIESALRLPEHLQSGAIIAVRIAAVGFVFQAIAGVMNTPQLVRLRMDINTLINAGIGAAKVLLIPFVLFMGGGLVGAVVVASSAGLALALIHTLVAKRMLPGLWKSRVNCALIRPLARFGIGLTVSSLASVMLDNVEKLFLTRFDSARALAHYSVAYTLASLLTLIPTALGQSLLPAFSRLQKDKDRASLQQLYKRLLRVNLLWIAPASLMLCAMANPFFKLWAGPEYGPESTRPFYILVCGLILNVMAYVPYTLLMAQGRSELIARIHLAELLPHLLCAALLTYWFGALGAAIAWVLRVGVDMALFFFFERRVSGLSVSLFANNRLGYLAALLILLLPALFIIRGNLPSFINLALACLATLIYFGIVWGTILSNEERHWARQMMRSLFGKLADAFA